MAASYTASDIFDGTPPAGASVVGNVATISFDPSVDTLNFDNAGSFAGVSASRISYFWTNGNSIGAGGTPFAQLSISFGGKSINLNMTAYYTNAALNFDSVNPLQLLTPTNITFWNGTKWLVGDQTVGISDANVLITGTDVATGFPTTNGPAAGDLLVSSGDSDTLVGGAGDDQFNIHGPNLDTKSPHTIVVDGGAGFDKLGIFTFLQFPLPAPVNGVSLDLRAGSGNWGPTSFALNSIEQVSATPYNDTLRGGIAGLQWIDSDQLNGKVFTFGADTQLFRPGQGWDWIQGGGTGDGSRVVVDYSNFNGSTGISHIEMQMPFGDNTNFRNAQKFNNNNNTGPDSMVGFDNLQDVSRVIATNGNDILWGGGNALGFDGHPEEFFQGNFGFDTINGLGGFDMVIYGNALSTGGRGVNVDLGAGIAFDGSNTLGGGNAGNVFDTLINIEGVAGSNGNDTLIGSDINNYFQGGAGNDTIDGGEGLDNASYQNSTGPVNANLATGIAVEQNFNGSVVASGTDTLINIEELRGTDFADTLIGGSSTSTYLSLGGHPLEMFEGRGGNDFIQGAVFNPGTTDHLNWAEYRRAPGAVSIDLSQATGTLGTDRTLVVDDSYGTQDTLVNINGVVGSRFDDALVGDEANNAFRGLGGNDLIDGGIGSDTALYNLAVEGVLVDLDAGWAIDGSGFWNSAANNGMGQWSDEGIDTLVSIENAVGSDLSDDGDLLRGADGVANRMWGLGGGDLLDSRDSGADSLYGGAGDDVYIVKAGDQVFETNPDGVTDAGGHDMVQAYFSFNMNTTGGAFVEDAQLKGAANLNINGNVLSNLLAGNAFNNKLTGNGGDDTLVGGLGNDTLIGSGNTLSGGDWVSYDDASKGVTVDLQNNLTPQDTVGDGLDLIQQMENLGGSRFGDSLSGSATNNRINGGGGNDTIAGAAGLDTLTGGAGADRFLFNTTPALNNVDTIVDFTQGTDKIVLSLGTFGAPTLAGGVTSSNFKVGVVADTANRVLLFQPGTTSTAANLFYDADGNGAGAKVLVASFAPSNGVAPPTLGPTDFATTP